MTAQVSNRPSLPPNQHLAAAGKWPLVGERAPAADRRPWSISIGGVVDRARIYSLDELLARPRVERAIDVHCVTRWSMPEAKFSGIRFVDLLAEVGVGSSARFVSFVARSERNHSTSLPIKAIASHDPLIAFEYEGSPIESAHGGPARMVVPGRYFYKSVKWIERIELLENDRLGYWEAEAGYHNEADPWKETRYVAGVDRATAAALASTKNLDERNLLSLSVAGLNLAGLSARKALLRNADFTGCILTKANFDRANLSNARFGGADLREANFASADVEGADFSGADLRRCDFRSASLFGATFRQAEAFARIDRTTLFTSRSIEALAPEQRSAIEAGSIDD
jgi:DMSO/TMAO reductase YedYZ molybdopterin-dependent catalytic subunit